MPQSMNIVNKVYFQNITQSILEKQLLLDCKVIQGRIGCIRSPAMTTRLPLSALRKIPVDGLFQTVLKGHMYVVSEFPLRP